MRPAAAPRGAHSLHVVAVDEVVVLRGAELALGAVEAGAQYVRARLLHPPAARPPRSLPAHRALPASASPPKARHSVSTAEEGLARQKPRGRTRVARVVLSGHAAFGGQGLQ